MLLFVVIWSICQIYGHKFAIIEGAVHFDIEHTNLYINKKNSPEYILKIYMSDWAHVDIPFELQDSLMVLHSLA